MAHGGGGGPPALGGAPAAPAGGAGGAAAPGGGGGGLAGALGAAAGAGGGLAVADVVAIIQAMRPPAEPERDTKLKCFDSGDPQEWLQWRARFVNIARCKNWNDEQQRRALSQSMSGKAIEATQHVRIEEDAALGLPALTAEEALNAYEAKFVTAAGTTRARSEFLSAAQTNGETMTQWHTRVSTLYRRAHPGVDVETSHELIERFCLGMWSASIAERTITDQPPTMTQALNDASRHAAAKLTMQRRLDGGGRSGGRQMNAMREPKEATDNRNDAKKMAAITCFFCKKPSHMKKDCYAYQRHLANKQGNKAGNTDSKKKPVKAWKQFGRSDAGVHALTTFLESALAKEESKDTTGGTSVAGPPNAEQNENAGGN